MPCFYYTCSSCEFYPGCCELLNRWEFFCFHPKMLMCMCVFGCVFVLYVTIPYLPPPSWATQLKCLFRACFCFPFVCSLGGSESCGLTEFTFSICHTSHSKISLAGFYLFVYRCLVFPILFCKPVTRRALYLFTWLEYTRKILRQVLCRK